MIDAEVLARAGEVFDLHPLPPVDPAQLALRRACVRRGTAVIDGNRYLAHQVNLILETFWQFRAAREHVECLAHLVRRRNQEVNIAPVKEIKLIRFFAGGPHGPPHTP